MEARTPMAFMFVLAFIYLRFVDLCQLFLIDLPRKPLALLQPKWTLDAQTDWICFGGRKCGGGGIGCIILSFGITGPCGRANANAISYVYSNAHPIHIE
jgi:hypothetical protein